MLAALLASCTNDEEESSQAISEDLSSQSLELTEEKATELIERDRLITDIFLNNSLCEGKNPSYTLLANDSEYAEFEKIELLLKSTYTEDSGISEMFLSYPDEKIPAVKNENGKTSVLNHIGSSYSGYVKNETVEVFSTDNEDECLIKASTASGAPLEFRARLVNGEWLLEDCLYTLNPPKEASFDKSFPGSDYGSFREFKGDVLVIELFVADNEAEFDKETKKQYHEKIESAFEFITEQSARYGNEVNVTYGELNFEHDGILGTRALDFDIVFAETGFGTLQRFAEANFDLTAYDNYMLVVCHNKEAEASYNRYNGNDETEIYFGERVIIGSNTNESEICVSALGLLGAYGFQDRVCDEYTESLYHTYFEDDIMVLKDITKSTVSPVTAYACGMTDKLPTLYRVFYYE